ncbi:hypothetical protein C8J57DRAFT_987008, partial [Mycena rebaudengoi]
PRPKNAFIIFRVEFTRLHHSPHHSRARAARRGETKAEGRAVTVSRKAADAWRQLSSSDRKYYQRLAEHEKARHARQYPNYLYRP